MEKSDAELITRVASHNHQLRELYKEHLRLEKEVARCGRYSRYSASASLLETELKKRKLRGMDTIMSILNDVRRREESSGAVE